jgi:arylsulfatase A-like enzyme
MTHFDVAPTVLDLLGLGSPDRRFGLGVSLFADISADTYAAHQQQVLSESILSNSPTYDAFWKPRPDPGKTTTVSVETPAKDTHASQRLK